MYGAVRIVDSTLSGALQTTVEAVESTPRFKWFLCCYLRIHILFKPQSHVDGMTLKSDMHFFAFPLIADNSFYSLPGHHQCSLP
jgi:hypothetical protein